jgi:hypothetical protein
MVVVVKNAGYIIATFICAATDKIVRTIHPFSFLHALHGEIYNIIWNQHPSVVESQEAA